MLIQITINLARVLQVFIEQFGMGLFYLYMAILLLKRSRDRLNILMSGFFLNVFIGTVVNVIYVFIVIESLAIILNFITYFLFCFAQVFLLGANILLLKSEKTFNSKLQVLLISGFACLLLGLLFIPNGIQINESTNYIPAWNLTFLIYALITTIGYSIIPNLYVSALLYKRFKTKELKRKWSYYVLGILLYYIEWCGVSISNYLNDPMIRLIWNTFALSLIISAYLIYYGIGKSL